MSSVCVGILDCGISGNIVSIENAIHAAGGKSHRIKKEGDFQYVDKLILPGVGSFSSVMRTLELTDLKQSLIESIAKKATLGICLGMQMLGRVGFEYGVTPGLGFFNAEVSRIQTVGPIPHIGFSRLTQLKSSPLFSGIEDEQFYFMHSYEVINYTNVIALNHYHAHPIVAAMNSGHIYGVQFHPEKSRQAGIHLLQNFIRL